MTASTSGKANHIAVIDPAQVTPELDCFNHLALLAPGPLSYHLPTLHGFASLKEREDGIIGIIVFGSRASVLDDAPWQRELSGFLASAWSRGIPTFGICYGHQLIAHILGGTVERQPHKHQGMRTVELLDDPLWGKGCSGQLVVSHQDMVTSCPPSCRIVARSREVAIDGLAHKQLPIWSLQSHPEATPWFLASMHEAMPCSEGQSDPFAFGRSLVVSFMNLVWQRKQGTRLHRKK